MMVSSVISKPSLVINSSDKIYEALEKMLERELSTCPVVDTQGKFLGQITDSVFIKALILVRSGENLSHVFELSEHFLNPPTVSSFTSIDEIAIKIFSSQSQRIFVVDSTNKLLGVISPKNVLKFLATTFGYIDSEDLKNCPSIEQQLETKLRDVQVKLKDATARKLAFENILEKSDLLVIVLDSNLNLFYVNQRALQTLGLQKEFQHKHNLIDILAEQSYQEIKNHYEESQKRRSNIHVNTYLSLETAGKTGSRYEVSVNVDWEPEGLISIMGKNIDADRLLKKLNGIYT